ncbi:MAG: hypothetical protein ACFFAU_16455 [Candidatus Hodarchaeota archaeon]
MVYRLTRMNIKVKFLFFILIWLFSAICAILGSMFIATAVILPNTPYNINVNSIIIDIRQDMGSFQRLEYQNPETGETIVISLVEIEGRIQARSLLGNIIPDFRDWFIIEIHENGSIFYIQDPGILVFDLFNGTIFEVKANKADLGVDFDTNRLYIQYVPGNRNTISKISWDMTATELNQDQIGNYFIVTNRGLVEWFYQIVHELSTNFAFNFYFIGQLLLINVVIGGGAGILTAFILIVTRLTKVFSGKYWTYLLFKALNGKLGKLLSYIPIFDFAGYFYVEERFVNVINLSSIGATMKELYKQRWYDMLFFPTALAAILTIFFVQNYPSEDKIQALTLSPLLSPIVLILLLFYMPIIWSFDEGRFKRMQVSDQGDIIAVRPLGKILRDGLGIVIGFSGILSLGALAVEITESIAQIPISAGKVEIAGFTLDIFSLILLVLWTIGLFLLLLGSNIVGASLLAVNYLQSSHLENIENLRVKSAKNELISNWGSITSQFTPVAKEAIYVKEAKSKSS